MTQARLCSPRIDLVPLGGDHLEFEVLLESDPDVRRYLGNGNPLSRAEIEAGHQHRITAADGTAGIGYWVGVVAGECVGRWVMRAPDRPDQGPSIGQAELGFQLLPRYWGQGLASEGVRELVRHGFEDLGLKRIFSETMTVNTAARATLACVGMEYIRVYHPRWKHPISGTEHGEVEYAITRDY
ncbi:GNAT family N-acetyltransferase [Nocardia sp. NBC_00416]|uniref:GNAT family N-acetyltransferase n=1 Tax=Nocardia sp. NBC_00416 TaxID=2975991 RepID=UPI002E242937